MVPAGFGVLLGAVDVVVAGLVDVWVLAEVVPFPAPAVPVPEAGVAAGADTGNDVSGVGSGGSGFAKMPATNSGMPVTESLFRNLYQVVKASFHSVF